MAESLARPLPVLALALEKVRLLTIVVVLVGGVVALVSACAQATEIDRLLTVTVVVVDDVGCARLLTSAVLVTLSLNVRSAALPLCLLACALVRVFLGWTPFRLWISDTARLSFQVSKATETNGRSVCLLLLMAAWTSIRSGFTGVV